MIEYNPEYGKTSIVNVGVDQWVEIDKVFGPQCSSKIRVKHDFKSCEWVIEEENFNDWPTTWHERARFNAQEFYKDKYIHDK